MRVIVIDPQTGEQPSGHGTLLEALAAYCKPPVTASLLWDVDHGWLLIDVDKGRNGQPVQFDVDAGTPV